MKMPKETTYQFLSSDTVGSLCPRLSRPYNSILSFGPASFPLWRLHTCCSLRQRSKVPFLYLKGNEVLSHSNKFLNALKTKLASKQTKNKQKILRIRCRSIVSKLQAVFLNHNERFYLHTPFHPHSADTPSHSRRCKSPRGFCTRHFDKYPTFPGIRWYLREKSMKIFVK